MAPPIVKPGGKLTVTMGPATGECGGPASSVTWNFVSDIDVGLREHRPCATNATTCVFDVFLTQKAYAKRWLQFEVTGSSPAGGWGSSAPYYLDSRGFFAITGLVTDRARNGLPGLTVRLTGPTTHEKFKSADDQAVPGFYSFAVKKKGSYTLSVTRHGRTARTTVHVSHKFNQTELTL